MFVTIALLSRIVATSWIVSSPDTLGGGGQGVAFLFLNY